MQTSPVIRKRVTRQRLGCPRSGEAGILVISKFNDDFPEYFFEVLHISVGQKIMVLETRPDFLTFSAKTQNCF
jgi:hypothetical protein